MGAFGNFVNAILILFIFSILNSLMSVSIGISNIKRHWEDYKCNPGIMPLAGVFGHDPAENYKECIKKTQTGYMSQFLDPVYESLNYFAESGSIFTEIFERMKLFGNQQDLNTADFANVAGARLYGVAGALNEIFISTVDTFSKLTSTVTILFYVVQSALVTAGNSWNELPGTMIKIATLGAIR